MKQLRAVQLASIRILALIASSAMIVTACSSELDLGSPSEEAGEEQSTAAAGPDSVNTDCVVVDLAVSSEKIELLSQFASEFNNDNIELSSGQCVQARVQAKASGLAASLLADGWDEQADGPRPVIWSPAASTWGALVNQWRADAGQPELVGEGVPFMVTPLVIAMPEPMAQALGWPDQPIGWAEILELSTSEEGWASAGHPEWGEFRLGKTNPNFSTSGLAALVAQTYAAAGKTSNLSFEDLSQPTVIDFSSGVEQSVVHYGDTTLTFLNNWYKADQRGAAMAYVSAAAVEEKSVIDYNQGNPDGVLEPGENPRPPKVPLVAIYPTEGTLYSDNPLYAVDGDWVDEQEAEGGQLFIDYVQTDERQQEVLGYGFRPGSVSIALGEPLSAANGVDPTQPSTLLDVPDPAIMADLLDLWDVQRKGARVLLVLDVSGSMGEKAGSDSTRLELAVSAIGSSFDQFKGEDIVGLYTFTTGEEPSDWAITEVVPPAPIDTNQDALTGAISGAFPSYGTPLYEAISVAYADAEANYDPELINAIIVLSDGANDDGQPNDDDAQLEELLKELSAGSEGQLSRPVRVFPIAYGEGADLDTLGQIADASASKLYTSSDPRSIDKVFADVVSNF